jgi:hypothetical protein
MENSQPSEIIDEQNDCWNMIEEDLKQRPPALEPIYVTDAINQPVLLYDGSLAIEQNGRTIEGSGKVEFAWFPHSGIKYSFQSHPNEHLHPNLDAQLRLTENEVSVKISLSHIRIDERIDASGTVPEAISIGSGQNLEYLLCHIVNFHDVLGSSRVILSYSSGGYIERNVLEAENWKLTLDQLPTTTEYVGQLNRQGGFALTHVAKLEKSDGQTFTGTEAIQF